MVLKVIPEKYAKFIKRFIFDDPAIRKYLMNNDVVGFLNVVDNIPSSAFKMLERVYSWEDHTSSVTPNGQAWQLNKYIQLHKSPRPYGLNYRLKLDSAGNAKLSSIKDCIKVIIRMMLREIGCDVELGWPF